MAKSRTEEEKKRMSNIADRMRLERLSRGYTQEEFAEMLEVSSRQYGRYENKKAGIPFNVIFGLRDLGIDLSYLLDGVTYRDQLIRHCFQTMPQDMLLPKLSALRNASHDFDTAEEQEQPLIFEKMINIVNDLLKYGKEHYYDSKLREVQEIRYDTLFYEACRDELIKKHSTAHRPQIK